MLHPSNSELYARMYSLLLKSHMYGLLGRLTLSTRNDKKLRLKGAKSNGFSVMTPLNDVVLTKPIMQRLGSVPENKLDFFF